MRGFVGTTLSPASKSERLLRHALLRAHVRAEQQSSNAAVTAVNCHHNYVQQESHFGETVWVTRKGAVRAGAGELGIIPGSMGAKSFIVRGKGNADAFCSCSHGAGRGPKPGSTVRRPSLTAPSEDQPFVGCARGARA